VLVLVLAAAARGGAAAPATTAVTVHREAPVPSFTFVGGGDIAFVGSGVGAETFAGIRRFLHADLVFGNLEGTLAVDGSPKCAPYGVDGCFTFRADPASAAQLRAAGFTLLNLANNHALDYGPVAQSETIAALRKNHLAYDGLPGQIALVKAGDVRVAVIGCAPYPWAQSLRDIRATAALVRRARSEADVVLVYMHAGAEGADADHVPYGMETFLGEERGDPRAFAHAMIDAGASLVFASGPHTLRGMEWYHGHLIAYSLGNLAANGTLATDGTLDMSALLTLTMNANGKLLKAKVVPLRLEGEGTPEYDPTGQATRFIRTLSDEDFKAPHLQIAANGTISPP
jgi:hypothetical protein